jgi:hypothetical protein
MQCLCSAYAVPIQCLFSAYSVPIQYLFSVYSVPIQCLCSAYAVPIQCLCSAYSLPIQCLCSCLCSAYAVHMQCLCSVYSVPMQCLRVLCVLFSASHLSHLSLHSLFPFSLYSLFPFSLLSLFPLSYLSLSSLSHFPMNPTTLSRHIYAGYSRWLATLSREPLFHPVGPQATDYPFPAIPLSIPAGVNRPFSPFPGESSARLAGIDSLSTLLPRPPTHGCHLWTNGGPVILSQFEEIPLPLPGVPFQVTPSWHPFPSYTLIRSRGFAESI